VPPLLATPWRLAILDEAQAIKTPGAKQTRAAKQIDARARIALSGAPVENRLGDLWSIFDFLNPGLLGSAKAFSTFTKRLSSQTHNSYAPLCALVRPYILRRLKTDKSVISDLPDKTEVKAFCQLTRKQAALYQQSVADLATEFERADGMQRRGVVLASLMRLKQICNHPSQWLGDGSWSEVDSGKLARLREIAEVIAARQEKVLVFTQFREMTTPLAAFLDLRAQRFGGRSAGHAGQRHGARQRLDDVGREGDGRTGTAGPLERHLQGLFGRHRLARRAPAGTLLQGRHDASVRGEDGVVPVTEGYPLHVQLSGLGIDVQACGGGVVRHRRATGSSAGVALHAPQGQSAGFDCDGRVRSIEDQGTGPREGARERRSLGDVRHRNGADDTREAGSIRPGGINAIHLGQRGRVVQAGGYDPAGETERARAQAAGENTTADTGEASSDIGTHA